MKLVNFIEKDNKLRIELEVTREEALESLPETYDFADLIEWQLCNGWDFIYPEDIGALTSSPIISNDVERDSNGLIINAHKAYWFPSYQVINEVEEILKNGFVEFQLINCHEN